MYTATVIRCHSDCTCFLFIVENSSLRRNSITVGLRTFSFSFLFPPPYCYVRNPFPSSQYNSVTIGPWVGISEFCPDIFLACLVTSMVTSPEFKISYFTISWLNWINSRVFSGFSLLIVCLTNLPALFCCDRVGQFLEYERDIVYTGKISQATPTGTSKEERETLTWKEGRCCVCMCLYTHSYLVYTKPKEKTHSQLSSGLRKFRYYLHYS